MAEKTNLMSVLRPTYALPVKTGNYRFKGFETNEKQFKGRKKSNQAR